MTSDLLTEGPKRGRGRPRLSDEEKARRKAERDAAKGVGHNSAHAYSEDELFSLLLECEPGIGEAERVAKQAADGVKRARQALAAAFGGMAAARKKLDLFRRARTDDGVAEARELIKMRERQREVFDRGDAGEARQDGLQ